MSSTHDLGPVDRIPPGEGRNFVVAGRRLAVFRTRSGEVYAVQGACPHKGGPLADGLVGGGCVVCPLHGRKFALSTGAAVGHEGSGVATFAVTVTDDGHVRVRLPDGTCEERGSRPSAPR